MTTTTKVLTGDRVKVTQYEGKTDSKYANLDGLIVAVKQVRNIPVYLVLLDDDPSPRLASMLGGLPCYDYELEKL